MKYSYPNSTIINGLGKKKCVTALVMTLLEIILKNTYIRQAKTKRKVNVE